MAKEDNIFTKGGVMEVREQRDGAAVTIFMSGKLNGISAPQLEEYAQNLDASVTTLTLDMTDMTYVSSAGLRALLFAMKKMAVRGGDGLKITNIPDAIMDVLTMSGFSMLLGLEED